MCIMVYDVVAGIGLESRMEAIRKELTRLRKEVAGAQNARKRRVIAGEHGAGNVDVIYMVAPIVFLRLNERPAMTGKLKIKNTEYRYLSCTLE